MDHGLGAQSYYSAVAFLESLETNEHIMLPDHDLTSDETGSVFSFVLPSRFAYSAQGYGDINDIPAYYGLM